MLWRQAWRCMGALSLCCAPEGADARAQEWTDHGDGYERWTGVEQANGDE